MSAEANGKISSERTSASDDTYRHPKCGKRIIVIVCTTAVGKTKLSLELAKQLNGEIICADSIQVYQGLPIASAKPLPGELEEVRHHLLDISPATVPLSVHEYVKRADAAISEIAAQDKTPIICGGTFYWVEALLLENLVSLAADTNQMQDGDSHPSEAGPGQPPTSSENATQVTYIPGTFKPSIELLNIPEAQQQMRQHFIEREQKEGLPALFKELSQVDPERAARLPATDSRKIRRSLELYALTGYRHSELITRTGGVAGLKPRYNATLLWVQASSEVLSSRIRARIREMLRLGLLTEVLDFSKHVQQELSTRGGGLSLEQSKDLLIWSEPDNLSSLDTSVHRAERWIKRLDESYLHLSRRVDELSSRRLKHDSFERLKEVLQVLVPSISSSYNVAHSRSLIGSSRTQTGSSKATIGEKRNRASANIAEDRILQTELKSDLWNQMYDRHCANLTQQLLGELVPAWFDTERGVGQAIGMKEMYPWVTLIELLAFRQVSCGAANESSASTSAFVVARAQRLLATFHSLVCSSDPATLLEEFTQIEAICEREWKAQRQAKQELFRSRAKREEQEAKTTSADVCAEFRENGDGTKETPVATDATDTTCRIDHLASPLNHQAQFPQLVTLVNLASGIVSTNDGQYEERTAAILYLASLPVLRACIQLLDDATVRYAKRQTTWIKGRLLKIATRWSGPRSSCGNSVPLEDQEGKAEVTDSEISIYKLDSSSVGSDSARSNAWADDVLNPALEIIHTEAQCFDHDSGSTKAASQTKLEQLKAHYGLSDPSTPEGEMTDRWAKRTCEVCDRVLTGPREWQMHLKGSGHRAAVKRRRAMGLPVPSDSVPTGPQHPSSQNIE